MDEDTLIPIVMFLTVGVTTMVWLYLKFRSRVEAQQTIRLALEKGTELSPEFMKQLAEPEPPKDRDLRRGMIWIALGAGMILLALGINEPDAHGPLIGSASFPILIGAAYIIMWRYGARRQ
jgi:hypothetical protein